MTDSQMTLLAFALGLGLMAGYVLRVSVHLLRARRFQSQRTANSAGMTPSLKVASVTEQKPRNPAPVR